jgi:hypothetical protein
MVSVFEIQMPRRGSMSSLVILKKKPSWLAVCMEMGSRNPKEKAHNDGFVRNQPHTHLQ